MSRAEAVHRGADGSVHFLLSTDTRSELVVTDPVLGMRRLRFDGPCRLVPRGLRHNPDDHSVQYESISAEGSTRVTVSPGQEPFLHTIGGVCWSCAFPLVDRFGKGHDYELWPVCPGEGHAGAKPSNALDTLAEPLNALNPSVEVETPVRAPLRAVEEPELSVPEPERAQGMMPVPVASTPDWTDLSEIESPRWGPGWLD